MAVDPVLVLLIAAASAGAAAFAVSRMLSVDLIYMNTRYNVIGNPFMSGRRLSEAMSAGRERDVAGHLDGKYFPVADAASPREAERNVRRVNRRFVEEAVERVPQGIRPFYEVLLMPYEMDEVRAACAAVREGRERAVERVGRIDAAAAERIARASTPDEAVAAYLSAIGRGGEGVSEHDLDTAMLREMADAARRLRGLHGRPLGRVLRTMLDAELVRLALRAGVHGGNGMEGLDIPEGYEVARWVLDGIARDASSGLRSLAGTALSAASEATDPVLAEAALRRGIVAQVDAIYSRRFSSVGPLTRFLVLREFEAANVRAVLLGSAAGLSWDDIEPVVTTEAAV